MLYTVDLQNNCYFVSEVFFLPLTKKQKFNQFKATDNASQIRTEETLGEKEPRGKMGKACCLATWN